MWSDLWAAIALVLVAEGLMPFLSPDVLRRTLVQMSRMRDRDLRILGLISMVSGALLLYAVRG